MRYSTGEGVPQNYAQAIKWFTRVANRDYDKARYNLGIIYSTGMGVEQDYQEAIKWFAKSAENGDSNAQYNLGSLVRTSSWFCLY